MKVLRFIFHLKNSNDWEKMVECYYYLALYQYYKNDFLKSRNYAKKSIEFSKNHFGIFSRGHTDGILILGLRGGLREIPINQSDAYFSQNQVLNVAGVNSMWNMGNVFFQNTNNLKTNPSSLPPASIQVK